MVTSRDEDLKFLCHKIYGDKEVTKFTTGRVFNKDETKAFFHKKFAFEGLLGFAPIIEKATNEIIGHGGILKFNYYNNPNDYEFGYIFQKPSWGLGYATEIALGQIETIKKHFPASTVLATVHPENIASQKVLKKVGMEFIERIQISRGMRDVYMLK